MWQGSMNLQHVAILERTFNIPVSVPVTYENGERGSVLRWVSPPWLQSLRSKVKHCQTRQCQ